MCIGLFIFSCFVFFVVDCIVCKIVGQDLGLNDILVGQLEILFFELKCYYMSKRNRFLVFLLCISCLEWYLYF